MIAACLPATSSHPHLVGETPARTRSFTAFAAFQAVARGHCKG